MMKLQTLLAALGANLLLSAAASACTPCATKLTLEETVKKADLIVIGTNETGELPAVHEQAGPDTLRIAVSEILAGTEERKSIVVNSWDSMCPYGIVITTGSYVIFLTRRESMYDSIDSGCSVKALPLENDEVVIDERRIPLGSLKKKISDWRAR
ncbi:MAG: hypothetical protein KDD44_02665 [Bdellovibrionales bacterium]|nr:hypothetical protein [Bdellovibrionales bacterium]